MEKGKPITAGENPKEKKEKEKKGKKRKSLGETLYPAKKDEFQKEI